jgi:acyl-CoA synthetase (NDP forming)
VVDYATKLGLGLSSLVSVGNKADISSNDLLDYWEDDPDTAVALLYLESFGNPRRFSRIARRVGRRKPIVAVKSGRSAAGARASSSPAGALLAASDVTVDALFRQAGVVRTDTLAELFDVARLLASQPHPRGRRVGIVTNAGGPGRLCADACEAAGLEVAELSVAPAERYRRAVEALLASAEVDAAIVVFVPPPLGEPAEVAGAIRAAVDAAGQTIPVLAVFMSAAGSPPELRAGGSAIPSYAFPEDAARALGRAAEYGSWRERPEGQVPDLPDARRDEAAALLAAALAELPAPAWLPPDQVAALLGCYGIAMASAEAGGVELVVGVVHDPSFGPVVACGAGGVAAELLNDVAVRLTPLTDRDAAEMVRSLASFPLLDGYRGAPRADVAALEDLLLRVGALVEAHPQVAELDLDPVRALARGVVVVDARVRVEAASPRPPLASRRRWRPGVDRVAGPLQVQVALQHRGQGLLAPQRGLEGGQGPALPDGAGLAGGRPGLDHREQPAGLLGEHAGVLQALAGGGQQPQDQLSGGEGARLAAGAQRPGQLGPEAQLGGPVEVVVGLLEGQPPGPVAGLGGQGQGQAEREGGVGHHVDHGRPGGEGAQLDP